MVRRGQVGPVDLRASPERVEGSKSASLSDESSQQYTPRQRGSLVSS